MIHDSESNLPNTTIGRLSFQEPAPKGTVAFVMFAYIFIFFIFGFISTRAVFEKAILYSFKSYKSTPVVFWVKVRLSPLRYIGEALRPLKYSQAKFLLQFCHPSDRPMYIIRIKNILNCDEKKS